MRGDEPDDREVEVDEPSVAGDSDRTGSNEANWGATVERIARMSGDLAVTPGVWV
jgi:hypothetical protein